MKKISVYGYLCVVYHVVSNTNKWKNEYQKNIIFLFDYYFIYDGNKTTLFLSRCIFLFLRYSWTGDIHLLSLYFYRGVITERYDYQAIMLPRYFHVDPVCAHT